MTEATLHACTVCLAYDGYYMVYVCVEERKEGFLSDKLGS